MFDKTAIDKESFQAINDNEEACETDGFTGFRKVLLVDFARLQVANNKGNANTSVVSNWLAANISFPTEESKVGEGALAKLLLMGQHFLPNPRAMAAQQEAGILWGRNNIFDDYTKLRGIADLTRNGEELAFVCEWVVSKSKRNTKPGELPHTGVGCKA